MIKAIAINGSPQRSRGNTAMVLRPFLQGLEDAGAEVVLFYASRLKIRPCTCGQMHCWYETPGECLIQDEMQNLYPLIKSAEMLILATPVYVPMPGDMQNFINRLCPLVYPYLENRQGRTRARFCQDVSIQKIVLVSTGGWWEKENFDTLVRIVQEVAEVAGVEFGGAVLRPHAFLMRENGSLTAEGEAVLRTVRSAGHALAAKGSMPTDILDEISRPLISEEELHQRYNRLV